MLFSNRLFPFSKINYRIWVVGTSFVLLQFFLQLSSGVIIGAIMHEMHLSAFIAGLLSGCFYIIYTCLQIPVGILCDRRGSKLILCTSALFLAFGCMLFASSYSLIGLFIGRVFIGIGSSFAFVVLVHLVRRHYPIKNFSVLIGTTETLSFFVTAVGIIGMGSYITLYGWRSAIYTASCTAIFIAFLCWKYIPTESKNKVYDENYLIFLRKILSIKLLWVNGLFLGLSFAVITVFGALWSVPFLQSKLNCTLHTAGILTSFLFLGAGISCPMFGVLVGITNKRKLLTIGSCVMSAILLLTILYIPTTNLILIGFLMFMLGLCCCSYILAYAISNELSPANLLSASTGFTNTLALLTTPLLQPLIGYILENLNSTKIYGICEYQTALLILPCSLILAGVFAYYLPESS